MDGNLFKSLLEGAINGRRCDLEKLIIQYQPLINKYSYINGMKDEDLQQYIMLHIIKNISKFRIDD